MRELSSRIQLSVASPADLVFSVAVAGTQPIKSEDLTISVDGDPCDGVTEIAGPVSTRLHRVSVPAGQLEMSYRATVAERAVPVPVAALDPLEYSRPSRYCDSDRLAPVAGAYFAGLTGPALVRAVRAWVLTHITYAPGSSGPLDGALDTYLRRRGVCRDTAHLVVTFLRAMGLPARLVAVYAPGLSPMDFHAVVEADVDGVWKTVDATRLAPTSALLRICSGADAADTAFLSLFGGQAVLQSMTVTATVDGDLPAPDDEPFPLS
jgi:transglutaminase-like putative cysteine protease